LLVFTGKSMWIHALLMVVLHDIHVPPMVVMHEIHTLPLFLQIPKDVPSNSWNFWCLFCNFLIVFDLF
jgi:hypothetical protein